MIRVPLSSNFVFAIMFFLVEVLVLWAIHRRLKALEDYYQFRAVLNDTPVPIQCSFIPIISGELMAGRTRDPSVFILAFTAVIVLAIAALGAEVASDQLWRPVSYTHF